MSNHIDWGEGPWNNEPDHEVWIDPATDLDCMINRGPSGGLCGYVGVPPSHPWHGRNYSEIDEDVTVHGDLTYSDACQEGGEICHVPAEGREHDIWWFGFDCAHAFDVVPRIEADLRKIHDLPLRADLPDYLRTTYKDWDYVRLEVEGLARQLARVHGPEPTECIHGHPWRECKVCEPIIRWVREHPDTDWWTGQ